MCMFDFIFCNTHWVSSLDDGRILLIYHFGGEKKCLAAESRHATSANICPQLVLCTHLLAVFNVVLYMNTVPIFHLMRLCDSFWLLFSFCWFIAIVLVVLVIHRCVYVYNFVYKIGFGSYFIFYIVQQLCRTSVVHVISPPPPLMNHFSYCKLPANKPNEHFISIYIYSYAHCNGLTGVRRYSGNLNGFALRKVINLKHNLMMIVQNII